MEFEFRASPGSLRSKLLHVLGQFMDLIGIGTMVRTLHCTLCDREVADGNLDEHVHFFHPELM